MVVLLGELCDSAMPLLAGATIDELLIAFWNSLPLTSSSKLDSSTDSRKHLQQIQLGVYIKLLLWFNEFISVFMTRQLPAGNSIQNNL